MIITGDCLEVMKTLDSGSIDAIVTDPPYGIITSVIRLDSVTETVVIEDSREV